MIYAERNLVQNVFGEWIEPQIAAPPRCLSIPVTPDLRARDAAERASRQSQITWRRPEPVPPRIYVLPAGRSNGKRRSTKTRAALPKRRRDRPEPRRCACGRIMKRPGPICTLCWRRPGNPERLVQRVPCDNGCGRLLRPGRKSGICAKCHWKQTAPEVKQRWQAKKALQS